MHKAKVLLPTFLGTLGGVYLYQFPAPRNFIVAGVLAVLLVLLLLSVYRGFVRRPRLWGAILELWIGFLPAVTALAVVCLLWVTFKAADKSVAGRPAWNTTEMADLIKYLTGVVAGFAAAVVSDDPEENFFWPAFHFKRLAAKAVPGSRKEEGDNRFFAGHVKNTFDNVGKGWGFRARRCRARILAAPRTDPVSKMGPGPSS